MPIYALGDRIPSIDPQAYVHPDAVVIGDVRIGPGSTVWPGAVLRGDVGTITVGADTSVQDGTIVHCSRSADTAIGDRCVVGHNAHLEGCTIHDDSLVGSGSVVLHRAQVGPHALVGAGAVVGNDKVVPPRARALGVPARIVEDAVTPGDFASAVAVYRQHAQTYPRELRRID